MKRLFGLIGLTYLAALTAVFYFKSPLFNIFALICAAILVAFGILNKVRGNNYMFKTFIISGVTVAMAVLTIFLYQNYYSTPITDNYSDKEIYVEGYVCDEVVIKESSVEYLIQTERINSNPVSTKIKYTGYSEIDVRAFDKVELNAKAYADNNEQNQSHGIFLRAYESEPSDLTATGETKFSLYKYAIDARKDIRKALSRLMPKESASLCKAILLGDKNALSSEMQHVFSRNGTSFLIVVSGLHLSIVLMFVTMIIKVFTKRRIVLAIGSIVAVICFAALTGFNFSVIRASIAVIIYQFGRIIRRRSDPLNSLGFAALAMTITNPYAVGDLGLLMSFSATMGIILWANKISGYIMKTTWANKIKKRKVKAVIKFFVNLLSVSISAAIWILPINVIAFGKISPLAVIISFVTEPLASAILVLSLLASILYLFPFAPILTHLIGYAADLLCRLMIQINKFFAHLPLTSVKADGALIFFWIIMICVFVAVGYAIKAKRTYTLVTINISVAVLMIITPLSYLTADKSSKMTAYQSGEGVCIEVKKENNISLLSVDGGSRFTYNICDDITDAECEIDNIIIPDENYNANLLQKICGEYEINNLIINSACAEDIDYTTDKQPYILPEKTMLSIELNTGAKDNIITTDGIVYQYITLENKSVLFIPREADIEKLPAEYRTADYIILEDLPKNYELLKGKAVFMGDKTSISKKRFEKAKEYFEEFSEYYNSAIEIS